MLLVGVMLVVLVGVVVMVLFGVVCVGLVVVGLVSIVLVGVVRFVLARVVIPVSVVLRGLVVIVFLLVRGGRVPMDVQLDHRASGIGLEPNEVPRVVKQGAGGGDGLAITLVARRVLETDQVVQGTREVHHDIRSLHGQLDFGRAVFVGTV